MSMCFQSMLKTEKKQRSLLNHVESTEDEVFLLMS